MGPSEITNRVDVVIVGAGISGLAAARDLERLGRTTSVLEARDTIGGRCLRERRPNDTWIDLGGQWIGRTHHRLLALCAELGVDVYPTYETGDTVLHWRGSLSRRPDKEWPTLAPDAVEADAVAQLFNRWTTLAAELDLDAPWTHERAGEWDAVPPTTMSPSVSQLPYTQFVLEQTMRIGGTGGHEATGTSLLHTLAMHGAAPIAEQPEHWLIRDGAGQIPELLAEQIVGEIRTNTAVTHIHHDVAGCRVHASDGSVTECKSVILSIPVSHRNRINFTPPLPAEHVTYADGRRMGRMVKIVVTYPTAWWRARGLSGSAIGDLPTIQYVGDSSPADGEPGILVTFIGGNSATTFAELNPSQRKAAVLADLAAFFGDPATKPIDYREIDWSTEPWINGGYTAAAGPGVWTSAGSGWRDRIGPIVWAGTETSTRWPGYIEGALESAARAVAEVTARS